MALLKYLNNDGEWVALYGDALRNRLRCDKNLSDIYDIRETRKNLELVGDNNHTHFHDDRYIPRLLAEQEAREEKDEELEEMIKQEIKTRMEEDIRLEKLIEKEAQERKEADEALGRKIEKENQERKDADKTLNDKITQEIADRKQGDKTLNDKITQEIADRKQGDKLIKQIIRKIKDEITPIGTIMAWAVATGPKGTGQTVIKETDTDFSDLQGNIVWLECNGQSCAPYPKLAAILGKNNVPNFKGMFLRGYGDRSENDDKTRNVLKFSGSAENQSMSIVKVGNSVTHNSGPLGEIQKDTVRNVRGFLGHQLFGEYFTNALNYATKGDGNVFYISKAPNDKPRPGPASIPMLMADVVGTTNKSFDVLAPPVDEPDDLFFEDLASQWQVLLSGIESPDHFEGNAVHCDFSFELNDVVPTSEEVRPINVAVKFFIRAQ